MRTLLAAIWLTALSGTGRAASADTAHPPHHAHPTRRAHHIRHGLSQPLHARGFFGRLPTRTPPAAPASTQSPQPNMRSFSPPPLPNLPNSQGWRSHRQHESDSSDNSLPLGLAVLLAITSALFYRRHRHEDPAEPQREDRPNFRTKLKTVTVHGRARQDRRESGNPTLRGQAPRNAELPEDLRLHFRLYPGEKLQWSANFRLRGHGHGLLALTDRRLLAVTYRYRLGPRVPFLTKTMRRDEYPLGAIRAAEIVLTHRTGCLYAAVLCLWSYPVGIATAGVALAIYVGWQRRQVAVEVDGLRLLYPLAPLDQREVMHVLQPSVTPDVKIGSKAARAAFVATDPDGSATGGKDAARSDSEAS